MFGSSALDVAVGLAFLYLLLSLLCTAVNELVESFLRYRAEYLREGIKELLGGAVAAADVTDNTGAKVPGVLERLYTHPFVASLYSGEYAKGKGKLPAYIPSRQFALALLDLVMPAGANKSGAARATADGPAPGGQPVVVNVTPPAAPSLPLNPDQPLVAALRTAVATATPEQLPAYLRAALLALVDAAGDDMRKVRDNIEKWYDGTMDRVAGWYRRRVLRTSAVVGAVMAVFLNADTFAVADALARDQALRTTVVNAAEKYVQAHPQPPALTPVPPPEPAADQTPEDKAQAENEAKAKQAKAEVKAALSRVSEGLNEVRGFGWPLGWNRNDPRTIPRIGDDGNVWRAIGAWLLKVLGWVLTATAISLGAPFWFDLLNRLMVVRSTVKPTEKSPPEPSADKK